MPEVPAVPGIADRRRLRTDDLRPPNGSPPSSRPAVRWRARCPASSRAPDRSKWPRPSRGAFEDGGVLLAEAGTGTGKTLAYLVPAILSRRARADLHRHQEPAGADLLQGHSRAARGARHPVHRHVHEGARELSVPAPARPDDGAELEADAGGDARSSSRSHELCFCRSSASGRPGPRPAIAPSSRICPRTCRSGTRCRPPPKRAWAPSARATTTAS